MEGWLRKLYLTLKLRWICVSNEIPPMNISLLVDSFDAHELPSVSKMISDLVKSRKNELKVSGYSKFENCLNIIENSYEYGTL